MSFWDFGKGEEKPKEEVKEEGNQPIEYTIKVGEKEEKVELDPSLAPFFDGNNMNEDLHGLNMKVKGYSDLEEQNKKYQEIEERYKSDISKLSEDFSESKKKLQETENLLKSKDFDGIMKAAGITKEEFFDHANYLDDYSQYDNPEVEKKAYETSLRERRLNFQQENLKENQNAGLPPLSQHIIDEVGLITKSKHYQGIKDAFEQKHGEGLFNTYILNHAQKHAERGGKQEDLSILEVVDSIGESLFGGGQGAPAPETGQAPERQFIVNQGGPPLPRSEERPTFQGVSEKSGGDSIVEKTTASSGYASRVDRLEALKAKHPQLAERLENDEEEE